MEMAVDSGLLALSRAGAADLTCWIFASNGSRGMNDPNMYILLNCDFYLYYYFAKRMKFSSGSLTKMGCIHQKEEGAGQEGGEWREV